MYLATLMIVAVLALAAQKPAQASACSANELGKPDCLANAVAAPVIQVAAVGPQPATAITAAAIPPSTDLPATMANSVQPTLPNELTGFKFNPPSSSAPLAESAPFFVFFAILITVLMVRAKKLNRK